MSLWRHRDFLKLWIGQTISEIGSRITRDGLPLTAVLILGASPLTMSVLRLASFLPVSLFGLFIGVAVDRLARRQLMMFADVARGLLLLTIPVAAMFSHLHVWMLQVVAGVSGVLTLLFDVSYQAYVPWLVRREALAEANAKLSLTSAAAEVVGPGLTGVLVQTLTAPIAIFYDALSYFISAFAMWRLSQADTVNGNRSLDNHNPDSHNPDNHNPDNHNPDRRTADTLPADIPADMHSAGTSSVRHDWRREIAGGFALLMQSRVLRALAGAAITLGFAGSMMGVLYTLYAIKTLGMSPWLFGLTVTMGGVGSLIGAALSSRLVRKFGYGPVIIAMLFLYGAASLLIPLASGPLWRALVFMMAAQLFGDSTGVVYEILDVTLRQALTSDELLGRMNATIRVFELALTAVGSVVAGVLGQFVGIRLTLTIAAIGMILSTMWLIFSPIRQMRELPTDDAA
ncbi:MFS transporter [Alicyclobacillus curvatus]|nr:MFS transporter [Alicyclobacillus curvatus]